MKKILIFLCFLSAQRSTAQDEQDQHLKRQLDMMAAAEAFNAHIDSLYNVGAYSAMIRYCYENQHTGLHSEANRQLLAVYDKMGEVEKSDALLKEEIKSLHSASSLMSSSSRSLHDYLGDSANRRKIRSLIWGKYMEQENGITASEAAARLLDFLLTDQYIRGNNNFFLDSCRRLGLSASIEDDPAFDTANETLLKQVFNFYQAHAALFNSAEVGNGLNGMQFLLLRHDADFSRRDYYLKLIEEAVRTKKCDPLHLTHFIVRTEEMKIRSEGASMKRIDSRLKEVEDSLQNVYAK